MSEENLNGQVSVSEFFSVQRRVAGLAVAGASRVVGTWVGARAVGVGVAGADAWAVGAWVVLGAWVAVGA
jgi:hypothetical protein